jgi:hypothetical protein
VRVIAVFVFMLMLVGKVVVLVGVHGPVVVPMESTHGQTDS